MVNTHIQDIPDAIRAYRGFSPIHPSSAGAVRNELTRMMHVRWREQLTEAESRILRMVSQSYSQRQVSGNLFISGSTVKKHINQILKKFHVRSSKEAVQLFLPEWKIRLETLKEQLEHIPGLTKQFELVSIHGKGQKNEAILEEVIRKLQLREMQIPMLELKILVLEGAIRSLHSEEQQFISDRYEHRLSNRNLMDKLGISSKTFFERSKRILQRIYNFSGGSDSILGVEDNSL
jgi:DNA-binding CsgD family transcriptional regulator